VLSLAASWYRVKRFVRVEEKFVKPRTSGDGEQHRGEDMRRNQSTRLRGTSDRQRNRLSLTGCLLIRMVIKLSARADFAWSLILRQPWRYNKVLKSREPIETSHRGGRLH